MKYKLIISNGLSNNTHIGYRKANIFYYNHDSAIGCSTIYISSKFLISYKKI